MPKPSASFVSPPTAPRRRGRWAWWLLGGAGLVGGLGADTGRAGAIVAGPVAAAPAKLTTLPLHQRLPLQLKGIEVNYLGLHRAYTQYGPDAQPTVLVQQAGIAANNLALTAAGAADSQRLAYATNWQVRLQQAQAQTNACCCLRKTGKQRQEPARHRQPVTKSAFRRGPCPLMRAHFS